MADSFYSSPEISNVSTSQFDRKNIAYNLHKSMQLLDDAVGTPGAFLRNSKTPKMSRFSSLDTPRNTTQTSHASLLAGSFMTTPAGNTSSVFRGGDSILGSLPLITPKKTAGLEFEDMEDFTMNMTVLLEEDPGSKATMGLYSTFMEALKSNPSEHQLFDLLGEYEKLCTEQLQVLKGIMKKMAPSETKFDRTAGTIKLLSAEQQTWRLIKSLYQDRLHKDNSLDEDSIIIDTVIQPLSDKQVIETLYNRDASTRQSQLVIDWLENTAADGFNDKYYDHVEFFSDKSVMWENTLSILQQKSNNVPLKLSRPIVTEIDPDAPIRQNKPLEDLDKEDDIRLLKHIFAYLRSGQLDQAQKLCIRSGQAWRAATLEGWKLHHDPNYAEIGPGGEVQPIEGNIYRDVWNNVCWRIAQNECFNIYERGIYAVLSGNLKNLLPACQNWEDHLWAYYKVMVNNRVEQELQVDSFHGRHRENKPPGFWEKQLNPELIFQEIQASSSEIIQQEARTPYRLIQKYIILEDIDGLIEEMYEWSRDRSQTPRHLIRFMAHLVLFFRIIGSNTKEELCITILEAYVKNLIDDKLVPLVASYSATLPQNLQVICYAKFLEGIHNKEERQACLMYAEEVGLDIPLITKNVVENIRKRDVASFGTDMDSAITEEDRQKIEAIDWLVFDQSMRAEAIKQSNALMRIFLANKKLAACKEVFEKIPLDSIDIVIKQWQMQTGSAELPSDYCNATREYLCLKAYLDAHDNFNDWFQHFHHTKPTKPNLQEGSNFTERVTYEHKQKQYQSDLERWDHTLQQQTRETVCRINNVLLFVDGGWMVDQKMEDTVDECRKRQMELLRQHCLPLMCFLLITVLHNTGQFKECVQLADNIASNKYMLYKVFQKHELRTFLKKARESSLALLDQKLDAFGYPIS